MRRQPINIADLQKSACSHRNPHLFEQQPKPKRSKYKNVKVELDGHVFDSIKESKRYIELRMLLTVGEITNLELQKVFQLSVCKYKADFVYMDRNGLLVVEDVKSAATRKLPTYRLKKKLMAGELGIEIIEV